MRLGTISAHADCSFGEAVDLHDRYADEQHSSPLCYVEGNDGEQRL